MLRSPPAIGRRPDRAPSWFRSAEGRRYGRHFGALIALKIVLLVLLYFFVVAPQPRADTSPDRVYDAMRGAPDSAGQSHHPSDRKPTP